MIFKGSPKLTAHVLKSRLKKTSSQHDIDFIENKKNVLDELGKARGNHVLSTDLVLLMVVRELEEPFCVTLYNEWQDNWDVETVLEKLDQRIYDYVIVEVEKIIAQLNEKAERARAIRDWRPAEKFVEPEILKKYILETVQVTEAEEELQLMIPVFLSEELKLTICCKDSVYYVHDNGAAMRQLRKRLKSETELEQILCAIWKRGIPEQEYVIGSFLDSQQFLNYLKLVIFVAHADLYYGRLDENGIRYDYELQIPCKKETFDKKMLLEQLKDCVAVKYDEEKGLLLRIFKRYALSSETPWVQLELLEKRQIQISDGRSGEQIGEVFEMLLFVSEDLSVHEESIQKVCERFDVEFDGRSIHKRVDDKELHVLVPACFQFLYASVILSEFGCMIDL